MGWTYGWNTRDELVQELSNKAERHVVLFKLARHGNWGYKDIDESMGPCEESCPLSFFDLAPLPDDDASYAREWRERVKAYHARHDQKLAVGQTIKLTNGHTVRLYSLKPLQGHDLGDGILYRIPRRMLTLPEPEPMRFEQGIPKSRVA